MVLRRQPRTSQHFVSTRPSLPSSEPPLPPTRLRPSALFLLGLITIVSAACFHYFPSSSSTTHIATNTLSLHRFDSDTIITLPTTHHETINRRLWQSAFTAHQQFIANLPTSIPLLIHRPTELITATVYPHNATYSSVVFSDTITSASGVTTQTKQGWTFRTSDGAIVTLDQLLAKSKNGKEHLNDILASSTTTTDIPYQTLSFVPAGDHSFTLYPQANHTTHETTVTITPSLAPYLTNNTARSIFTLPQSVHSTNANKEVSTACLYAKCAALTFDDGPGQYTDTLLDILKKHETKATFFVLGIQAQQYADALKREVSDGHIVGNHTWNHPDLTLISESDLSKQITRTNSLIEKITGVRPFYLRPPYGAADDSVRTITRKLDMSSIFWSVDTTDWKDLNSETVCKHAVADTRAGSIIIMHDIHQTSVNAVPCIITALRKKGYHLVTVPELLGQTKPGGYYYEGE